MRSATTSRSPADSARRLSASSGDKPSPNEPVSGTRGSAASARSSRLRRRASARNQSSAVERAIARSQARGVPRRRIEAAPLLERRLEGLAREVLGDRPVLGQVQQIPVDVVEELLGHRSERRSRRLERARGIDRHCMHDLCTPPCLARVTWRAPRRRAPPSARAAATSSSRAARWAPRTSMFVQSSASVRSSSAIRASTRGDLGLEELELGRRRASPVAAGRRRRSASPGSGSGSSGTRLVASRSRSMSAQPPSYERSVPSSNATMRFGTASSSARSCETSRIVPGNASSAASSASRDLDVEVVRRLVEDEEVGARRDERARARAAAARRPRAR